MKSMKWDDAPVNEHSHGSECRVCDPNAYGFPCEDTPSYWTHPQLPALPGELEDDYIERFSEFACVNDRGDSPRGLE